MVLLAANTTRVRFPMKAFTFKYDTAFKFKEFKEQHIVIDYDLSMDIAHFSLFEKSCLSWP